MRRGKHGNHAKASRQHRWKPGGTLAANGYVRIRLGKSHPLADPNGYAYEHLVVWVSAGHPRPSRGEILHHRNDDKTDNRIENLTLMKRGEHNSYHLRNRRRCSQTGRWLPAGATLDGREHRAFPVEMAQ